MITTPRKHFCLLAALLAFSIVSAQALANNLTVFGPENFKLKWWCFHFSYNRFKVEKPSKGAITITKNTPQKKIWRGFVRLNRKTIPLRHFLTSDDHVLEKKVKLRSSNHLLVCLLGTHGASIQIKVKKKETVPLPKVSISASPPSIEVGKSSSLSWNSTNATACTIEPGIGSISVNGSIAVSPIETTTYTITVEGPGGSTSDSVTVVVVTPPEDVDYGIPEDDQQGGVGIVGETICILNGSNVEYRSDLTFPSPNSLGLSFEAFYNSRSQTLGALGYGWTHTYDASLESAFQIDGKDFVKIIDQSGRAHYFAEESPGSYKGVFKECTHVKIEEGESVWYRLDGTRYGFSTLGQLVWIEDEKGNRLELDYDSLGLLDTVTDRASSRALSFYYYGDGLLQRIEGATNAAAPDGILVTYKYDGYQNPRSVTYADGSGFSYDYTDPNDVHNMTEKKNKLNHLLNTWSYDAHDRATNKFSVDGKGANNINYFGETQVEVTDAYRIARTYNLEKIAGGKRVKTVQETGRAPYDNNNVVRWLYEENKEVIETESVGGTINQYEDYDERGNPGTVKLAVGTPEQRLIRYTYHPAMNVPLSRSEASALATDANTSKVTMWDYDDDLNDISNEKPTRFLHRIVEQGFTKDNSGADIPYEYVTTFTYNSRGQVLSVDGPLSETDDTTTFNYDLTTGDLLSIIQPLIASTIFSEYDAVGRVGKITDVNGLSKRFTYDAKGRVTAVINDADGSSIKITYNKAGLPDSVTDEDGVTQGFDYDANYGRLIRVTDMEKNYITYAYDAQGNQIEMSKHEPVGTRTSRKRWSYQHPTAPGKLWKKINADDSDTVYDYDSEGNIASVKDPNENTTYYAYDPLNRLKTVTQSDRLVTNYGYNTHGNLVSLTDAEGHITTYEYDDMGRVVISVSPDTGTVTHVYDRAGNTVTKKDAEGITVQYAYDTLNRLAGVHFPDPTDDIIYTYDLGTNGIGRLTGMTDPSGSISFTYDARGRLAKKTSTIFGHSYTIGMTHSPGNRALTVTYPTGRTLDFTRDGIGRMQGLSTTYNAKTVSLVNNITYNSFGGPRGLSTGAGGVIYNQSGECDCVEVANPGEQMERTYSYDSNSNLTSITATNIPWYNQTFTYDALNRLTNARGRYGTISYTYDNVGNRISRTVNGEVENYNYMPGTNRLREINNVNPMLFTYDANGNTTGIGNKVLIYNLNNRLIRVEQNGTILGEYTYNGLGQRVTKEVDGVTTVFHYGLDGKVIAESLPDGTLTAEYFYMGNIRIAKFEVDRGKMYYYVNDRLGTPQIMTDDNGNVVWEASYKPFGQARVNPKSTVENNFRFPGQYHDKETGLHYNYHRYYDPGTGRYITPDPIGLTGGMNLFSYVRNNPINFVDPSGLSGEDLEQFLISLGRVCFPLASKRGDWNIAWKGLISSHVDVIFADLFGAVGAAHWMKLREIREERSLVRRLYCCECDECGCECEITYDPQEIESRYRTDVLQHFHGRAYRISQGSDPQVGDFWWSVNPWTGQTVKGRMPPGP